MRHNENFFPDFCLAKKQNYYFCSRFRERNFSFSEIFRTMRGRAEAARRAHNPEVGGSNPPPATKPKTSRTIVLLFLCSHAAKTCFQLYGCIKKRRSRARFGFGKALPTRITPERSNPPRKKAKTDSQKTIRFHFVYGIHSVSTALVHGNLFKLPPIMPSTEMVPL